MLNGTTYIVRPRMQPRNRSSSVAAHLRRGPSSCWWARRRPRGSEQMKVRSSTRATSRRVGGGPVGVRGASRGRARMKVPASTSCLQRSSRSASEPSNQWIASGSRERGDLLDPGEQSLVLGGRVHDRRHDSLLFPGVPTTPRAGRRKSVVTARRAPESENSRFSGGRTSGSPAGRWCRPPRRRAPAPRRDTRRRRCRRPPPGATRSRRRPSPGSPGSRARRRA